jgi:RNA polymerase sigma factor (sigma-70 family)
MTDERQTRAGFKTTRWSLVVRARNGDAEGRRALEELCRDYWPPVYAFFRRDGLAPDAARDLTQGLFVDLLERGDIAGGDPGKGRFRSYLLACARHYQSNVRDRERAQKRGGEVQHIPIAVDQSESARDSLVAGVILEDMRTPERAFALTWARELLARALLALQDAEEAKGNGALFAQLRSFLEGVGGDQRYAELAEVTGMTEGALKVAVHRLRRRFRETLLRELGHTVENPADAEDELRELLAVFRAPK